MCHFDKSYVRDHYSRTLRPSSAPSKQEINLSCGRHYPVPEGRETSLTPEKGNLELKRLFTEPLLLFTNLSPQLEFWLEFLTD